MNETYFSPYRKRFDCYEPPHVCPPISKPTPQQVREHAAQEREKLKRRIANLKEQLASAEAELKEWQGI